MMLIGTSALLNADVLHALCAIGHGDTVAVVDANFPSDAVARQTCIGKLLTIENVSAPRAVEAILTVFPLDSFGPASGRMEVVGNQNELPDVQLEVQKVIDTSEGKPSPLHGIERFAFYEVAKPSNCVIANSEPRFYGCFLFTKGVITPAQL
jgi:L-fucose mutarotase